ncbi:hypothetical protein EJB05_36606 [Eragrostis curvula]|uniref:Uncharacterized protein n=1 Tax=Eragrostis curvula TaxID=38414 RepID=A0A5J9U9J6_9POAL|nr:hypothetical protein EJB05_36606 [Eragrostis curvula]
METFPSKLLLALALLLLAPLLEARKLGGSYGHEHLCLTSDGAAHSELNKVWHGVSRSGGRAPPAPKSDCPPQPGLQETYKGGGVVSTTGVSNRQLLTPPPPIGNTPPQYISTDVPKAQHAGVVEVLRALWDDVIGA